MYELTLAVKIHIYVHPLLDTPFKMYWKCSDIVTNVDVLIQVSFVSGISEDRLQFCSLSPFFD